MVDDRERHGGRQVAIVGRPMYSILLPVPIVLFIAALVTDITYALTETLIWLDFSSWLLVAGVVLGLLAAIFLFIDIVRLAALRRGAGWAHLLLYVAAWLVELVNMLVHNRDGWTAVVPLGLTLSIVGVLLILVAGWLWRPATAELAR